MPLTFSEVAKQLNELLDARGEPIVTIPWPVAYAMTGTSRWRQSRTDEIIEAAWEEYSLVVAHGHTGLFVMRDEDFAPSP